MYGTLIIAQTDSSIKVHLHHIMTPGDIDRRHARAARGGRHTWAGGESHA